MSETDQTTTPPEVVVAPEPSRTPHLNAARTHVWMVNPETDGLWECPIDYADIAEADGWQFAEDPNAPLLGTDLADKLAGLAVKDRPKTETGPTSFDPSKHTVDEVNRYVAAHFADSPGESARVLALEKDGKNRASIEDPFASGTPGDN